MKALGASPRTMSLSSIGYRAGGRTLKEQPRRMGRAAVRRRTDLHDGEDVVGRDQELHFPTLRVRRRPRPRCAVRSPVCRRVAWTRRPKPSSTIPIPYSFSRYRRMSFPMGNDISRARRTGPKSRTKELPWSMGVRNPLCGAYSPRDVIGRGLPESCLRPKARRSSRRATD
jgi:hypothetical protein